MAYTSGFTAVTGATFTASQYNTNVRDNFTAIWVYTTAGDIAYATSSNTATRLGIGSTGSILQSIGSAPAWLALGAAGTFLKSSGSAPVWGEAANIGAYYHNDATGYSYATATWRDMPNSAKVVTLTAPSTIVCIGVIENHSIDTPNYYGFADFKFNINGVDIDWAVSTRKYGTAEQVTSIIGMLTDVPAGNITIKIREICNAGSYYVTYKHFIILVIS